MSIKVLVVDDSALVRKLLPEILSRGAGIEVVGTAPDPYVAREKIRALKPDVITLDIEMPRMDGLRFLENLMRLRPMPVLIVSSLAELGAHVTLQALELGAVDYITKPKVDIANGLELYAGELIAKVRSTAAARPRSVQPPSRALVELGMPRKQRPAFRTTDRLVALGASTGGTEAIRELLDGMPADAPAVVIAQHIPASFSASFAERLDRSSPMSVSEARDRQPIVAGCAYVAPGGRHLWVERDGAHFRCRIADTDPVNRHRPSVDVLFRSVAQAAGANAAGAILTGMGDDGAQGLLEMRQQGAMTFAQDEASSVVWGMPGAAVKLGAAERVLPLERMAAELLKQSTQEPADA
ncbi:MAG: protein-glutamate methylesterase/protein-glutamine glutaminase [Gammaproteobacteria bacterium]